MLAARTVLKHNTGISAAAETADLSYSSYRCNGEGLVQDAIIHQLVVDVACCLANALQRET